MPSKPHPYSFASALAVCLVLILHWIPIFTIFISSCIWSVTGEVYLDSLPPVFTLLQVFFFTSKLVLPKYHTDAITSLLKFLSDGQLIFKYLDCLACDSRPPQSGSCLNFQSFLREQEFSYSFSQVPYAFPPAAFGSYVLLRLVGLLISGLYFNVFLFIFNTDIDNLYMDVRGAEFSGQTVYAHCFANPLCSTSINTAEDFCMCFPVWETQK